MTAAALPRELALIERLAANFGRSRQQLNGRHESDAELIAIPGAAVLALTTDSIVEEIETGLYADPFLIGWMTVTANASDLAAVGADPLGILLNQTLPPDLSAEFLARMQDGILQACAAYRLPVLGGDTNVGQRLQVGGCAVGLIPDGPTVTRLGSGPDDYLYASGRLGSGSGYALARMHASTASVRFEPRARMVEGRIVRHFASACMDTSDGVIPTLDELARLNHVGFTVDADTALDLGAERIASQAHIPPWLLLAGPHGEFELLFTVPPNRVREFELAAAEAQWTPLYLGRVMPDPGLSLRVEGTWKSVDSRRVRDLYAEVGGDGKRYLAQLLEISSTS